MTSAIANSHIALFPKQMANRRGDVARRQRGSRDLVEQRLKEVVIRPVNQSDANRCVPQGAGRGEPAETTAHDHHMWQWMLRHGVVRIHRTSIALADLFSAINSREHVRSGFAWPTEWQKIAES